MKKVIFILTLAISIIAPTLVLAKETYICEKTDKGLSCIESTVTYKKVDTTNQASISNPDTKKDGLGLFLFLTVSLFLWIGFIAFNGEEKHRGPCS